MKVYMDKITSELVIVMDMFEYNSGFFRVLGDCYSYAVNANWLNEHYECLGDL